MWCVWASAVAARAMSRSRLGFIGYQLRILGLGRGEEQGEDGDEERERGATAQVKVGDYIWQGPNKSTKDQHFNPHLAPDVSLVLYCAPAVLSEQSSLGGAERD